MNAHEHDAVHAVLYETDDGGYTAVTMDRNLSLSGTGRPPARVRRRFTETDDGKRHRTGVVHRIEHATLYEINNGVYSVVATHEGIRQSETLQPLAKTTRASAVTGNGMRHKPSLRTNVVMALRRDEQLGRSWRGSEEGG